MRESEVEKQFVNAVRAAGGQALKFTSQTMNGVPDRLVLLLGGKCAFVELKAPGKQMRILQRKCRQQLEALGFPVFCVDRLEQIQPVVDALLHWTPGEPIPQGIGAKIPEMPEVNLPGEGRRCMKFVPHEYQRYCTEYIKTHPVAALFLDMGLGKTVITLSAIEDLMLNTFEVNKVLIIAPLRVARDTWTAEIEKWDHLKYLDISVIVGDAKTRIAAVHHPALIYIINRENIKWLVEYYEKNGMRWDFSMVVIDELSSFKNHQSLRFRSLRKVRPFVKRWVGLTGTPSSNGLMDLWAEIGILDGGERLGKFIGRYREAYFKAGSLNPATGVVFQYVPREGAEEMIYQRISDITISMKALDYLNMPDCVPTRYEVEMNADERKLYDMLKHDLLIPLKDGDIDAANAASLTGKLLQMSNGAVYDENGKARIIHDHKLEALEDLIEAANGQPVLVAYWFRHDRERIINHLSKLKIKVRDIKSSTDIRDWNAGNIPVALIHPASAGHGLNIQQGGHILIWFGLTWSLELYQQTNARLWRQGQTDVVTIHHIITKNTVDEDVMTALEQKDMTQEKLISAVKAQLGA